jgi:hypothetical protein
VYPGTHSHSHWCGVSVIKTLGWKNKKMTIITWFSLFKILRKYLLPGTCMHTYIFQRDCWYVYLYPGYQDHQHNGICLASNFFIGFTFIFCYWFWIDMQHTTTTTNKRKPLPHSRPHYRTNPLVCCKTRTCLNTPTPAPLFFSINTPKWRTPLLVHVGRW